MTENQPLQYACSIEELEETIKWDSQGLVPAIVQDAAGKEVLMLAYMNRESLRKSLETGQTWFWSRSRGELWNKGATSGNTQRIAALRYDCDGDTLLVEVHANGPACHTGENTCFYRTAATADVGEAEASAAGAGAAGGTTVSAVSMAASQVRAPGTDLSAPWAALPAPRMVRRPSQTARPVRGARRAGAADRRALRAAAGRGLHDLFVRERARQNP
ncbi:hypothetical protein HMSSN036_20120 [Paenibacillus macerans]|nr:hypothetical protein HMSSN036_20120 [Paenibacillus macerans]